MQLFKIKSLNVGKPIIHPYEGQDVLSGIVKQPVGGRIFLSKLNFEGDGQGDLVNHGGLDKAVNVYPADHYAYWENRLQRTLAPGSFGENLTLIGALEDQICIGDIFQLGEAIVQVSQPRKPCFKLAMRHGVSDLAVQVIQTGYTGFYLRVLQEGYVDPAQDLILMESHPAKVPVSFVTQIREDKRNQNPDALKQLSSLTELADSLRQLFRERLSNLV